MTWKILKESANEAYGIATNPIGAVGILGKKISKIYNNGFGKTSEIPGTGPNTIANSVVNNSNRPTATSIPSFNQLRNNNQLGAGRLPEYKVHIISQVKDHDGKPIRVSAYLPETISVDFSSDYKTPFDQSVLGNNLFGNILRAFGNSGIVQEMTKKVWDSSRGLSFDLPLVFIADDEFNGDSAENSDIMTPILKLLRLCAPSKKAGSKFLTPPGSSLKFSGESIQSSFDAFNEVSTDAGFDENTGLINSTIDSFGVVTDALSAAIKQQLVLENVTSVYIGNFMFLGSVECESVSQQYDTILGVDDKPLRATVNFRFSTSMVPTIEDLYRYFGKSINNVPPTAVRG